VEAVEELSDPHPATLLPVPERRQRLGQQGIPDEALDRALAERLSLPSLRSRAGRNLLSTFQRSGNQRLGTQPGLAGCPPEDLRRVGP
jgi:hypothetical protein